MARHASKCLSGYGADVDYMDLQEFPLPICDGSTAYGDPRTAEATLRVQRASALFVATAVYNYSVNAALKNVIELTGSAWEGKIVGFVCAAGGMASYMSVMGLANSLMLDFRCVIVPRFVYATGSAFGDDVINDAEVARRVDQLSAELVRFARALVS